MVTERLRREEEQRAKAAKKRRGRAPAEPPGWRTGPAWQEMQGRGKTKRRLKATAAIVFVAALALIAIRPELVIDKVTGKAAQDAKSRQPLPAETVAPTSAPSVVYPDQPTLREPFKGSPAVQWADGAAGIEVPEAQAVGAVSKDKVAATLEKAKQFLVAANLDRATLSGARPTAALALLDPKMDEYMADVEEGLSHPSEKKDPLTLFSRVDPAQLKLVGDVVKVRGRMWAEAGEQGRSGGGEGGLHLRLPAREGEAGFGAGRTDHRAARDHLLHRRPPQVETTAGDPVGRGDQPEHRQQRL